MNSTIKIILSVFLALSTIAFIVVWDLYISPNIDSVDVVVVPPDQQVNSKQTITGNEFIIESRPKSTLIDDPLLPEELESVVGIDTSAALLGNQIVSLSHFDFDGIQPNPDKGEAIRPIPDEWIYSQPGSLRRKDRINIYLFDERQVNIPNVHAVNSQLEEREEEKQNETDNEELEELTEDVTNEDFEEAVKEIEDQDLIETGSKPLLTQIPVVYAKDRSNNEVVDHLEADSQERYNATGQISDLELNLSESDFNLLLGYIKQGYRLYITYQ